MKFDLLTRLNFRFFVFGVVFGIVVIGLSTLHDAEAAPLRVRVRGTAKLMAQASRDQTGSQGPGASGLVLSGSLVDDVGQPLAVQPIVIRVEREANPNDGTIAEAMRRARGCDSSSDALPSPQARRGPSAWGVRFSGPHDSPEVIAVTDEEGRFCIRAPIAPDRYKAHLVYTPTAAQSLVDGVEREIGFDLTKRGLALQFDPTPRVVQLDTPRTTIDAIAIVNDYASPHVAAGILLVLANEKEEIARGVTDASGRAHFILPGVKLGSPGPGELRVSFAGDGETAPSSHTVEIERHVKVVVKMPVAARDEISPGIPEDGIPLLVEVGSSLGPLAEGSVEARIGEVIVGASPVERGIARLTLTFAAQGNEALVKLRYVPASPWYEPLGESTVRVPIRGPSITSKLPILLAGLAVLAFFLVGRVSAQKNKADPAAAKVEPPQAHEGKPRVEVIRAADPGQEGWAGRVVDAHEGGPIRGARVWIERGTFEGRSVLASVETSGDGRFVIPSVGPITGGERIAAEARLYARHTQDLPSPGEILITLPQRRRVLLAKLVTWARRRGAPFDARPEPTPGHVRRAASGEVATARWAEAVERAVFGPTEIDAEAEEEVDRLAPEGRTDPDRALPAYAAEPEDGDKAAGEARPGPEK